MTSAQTQGCRNRNPCRTYGIFVHDCIADPPHTKSVFYIYCIVALGCEGYIYPIRLEREKISIQRSPPARFASLVTSVHASSDQTAYTTVATPVKGSSRMHSEMDEFWKYCADCKKVRRTTEGRTKDGRKMPEVQEGTTLRGAIHMTLSGTMRAMAAVYGSARRESVM
jgi:hypothetical protein